MAELVPGLNQLLFYLACPYTHEHDYVQHQRYEQVTRAAYELMCQGVCVYSPITSMHYLSRHCKPNEIDWLHHDLVILSRCDKLIVLQLEGWEQSEGLRIEIDFAAAKNIPIEYMEFASGKNNQHSGS